MLVYTVRRLLYMIPMMVLISILCFFIISLQPGDFGSQYFANPRVSPEMVIELRERLGLNDPPHVQYLRWVKGIIFEGNFGYSFAYKRPVSELIWERMGWTVLIAFTTMFFTWALAIPIGIYSATHQYTFWDYFTTFFGFIGLSVPSFFMALILMFFVVKSGGTTVGGLFSNEYIGSAWSWGKFVDLLKHLWIPLIAIGSSGMAGLIRQMRGNLLDVLGKQYITTARSKGLPEKVVIYKHAVRNAVNPLITIAGMQLPALISGTIISAIVLNLPTMGPFFYDALINQDQYLVMTFLMFSGFLMLLGNLIADVALAWVDPRIRYH